jgi:hypothetical protein
MVKIVEVTESRLPFDLVSDVKAHMANDPQFYRKEYYPCMCGLQKKVKEGSCTNEDVMPMVLKACKSYMEKYDIPEEEFTKDVRIKLASEVLKDELPNLKKGEY